ncbi:MAG: hypothetical protein WCS73_01625, partial [Lentisphaeria bacterium]
MFFLFAVICFIVAGAEPYREKIIQRNRKERYRIVFLLDCSESMNIVDFSVGQNPDKYSVLPKSRQEIA